MMRQLYPHLTVEVDTEPFYADQVEAYKTALFNQRNQIRREMKQRQEDMAQWLVRHGFQCGLDYQQTESGYRFASDKLATFFKLAWS
jgi:hypothetical protein